MRHIQSSAETHREFGFLGGIDPQPVIDSRCFDLSRNCRMGKQQQRGGIRTTRNGQAQPGIILPLRPDALQIPLESLD